MNGSRKRGDDTLGVCQSVLQRVLLLPPLRNVSKYQDDAGDFALRIADRCGTVVDGPLRAVFGNQQSVVRQSNDHTVSQGSDGRAFDGVNGYPR